MAFKPVFIVDDDVYIRLVLQEVFQAEGYPVVLAEQGQAALELLKVKSTPDPGLIFVDVMMPVMDGLHFLSELERDHQGIFHTIPIFMMTAGADTQRLINKTSGVLKKPLDLGHLCKLAGQHCR